MPRIPPKKTGAVKPSNKQPTKDSNELPKPPDYNSAVTMPNHPPPGFPTDDKLPDTPPPTYDDAMGKTAPDAKALQGPKRGVLGKARGMLDARKATKLAGDKKAKQNAAAESLMAGVSKVREIAVTEPGMATGIDAAANLLDGVGLLETFVGACGGAGASAALSGTSTVLGVIQGVKAVSDRVDLGNEVDNIKARLQDTRTLEIISEFTGHGELARAVDRSQMIDNFLVSVFESSETEKELDALQAGINTAAGIASLAGTVTGGSGAAVGSALGIFNLAVSGGRMVHEDYQVKERRKEREKVDKELEEKFFHRWADKADVKLRERIGNTYVEPHIETQRFTESLWYKDDLAKLVLERLRERPYDPNNQRVLKLCGEEPDCLTPEHFDSLSPEHQEALLYSIQSTLSGEDKIFDGKKKNLDLAFQAAKADAELTFTRLRADIAGFEGSDDLLPFWCIFPKAGPLYKHAQGMGVDADAVVKDLFERALDEGPKTQKALHDLMHFPFWDKRATSMPGRMEARVHLLTAIQEQAAQNPEAYLLSAINNVTRTTNKRFMAESHNYQNITPYAEALQAQARQKSLDVDRLTTNVFNRAIAEGPSSVKALHDLLYFDHSLFNNQTSGTTEQDRLNTRILLLEQVATSLESRFITSVGSSARDIDRVTNKLEMAQSFGKLRNIHPLTFQLQQLATTKGEDPERITTDLFIRIVHEGDRSIEALREFLGFDGSWWNNETRGSTEADRLEARYELLSALADHVKRNPLQSIRNAMEQVTIGHDKVFIAQSQGYKNITPHAQQLHDLARVQGLNADQLTTAIFERTIEEGPESVEALRDLLQFDHGVINDQTRGSTKQDRMKTRLILLREVADRLESGRITSVQSIARDITRVTDKVTLAQSFGKLRNIHPLSFQLQQLAEEKGIDPDRLTTDLFIRIVHEGDEAIEALQEFLAFDSAWFSKETRNAQMDARLKLLHGLARYVERNPHTTMLRAMKQTAISYDKVFIANSYNYANITPYTAELRALAREKGLDADALTTRLFDQAIDDGPEGARALRELLSFERGLFYDETRTSTFDDRLEARLNLLQQVVDNMENAYITSVQSSARDIARITDKVELAQLYARLRTFDPLPPALRDLAESKGLNFEEMTSGLYRHLVEEGDQALEAFQRLMKFEDHFCHRETAGTTKAGRLEAQLTMLQGLIQYTQENPNTRLKWAIEQTMLVHNKVFLAQSHNFANISPLADKLHNLAVERGLDAERLTTSIFKRCIEEGPQAVEALHHLLEFQQNPLNNQTLGSTPADRLEARLRLLEALADSLDSGYIVSVQSASRDVERTMDKVGIAQRRARVREIDRSNDLTSRVREAAEAQHIDPARITTDLYRAIVDEGDNAVDALHDFLEFDHSCFNYVAAGTTREARMHARLRILNALANYREDHPNATLESGMRNVLLAHDKNFIARSYQYNNITHLTNELVTRAKESGSDPERIVTGVFDKAIQEGPGSVKALHDLLEFQCNPLHNQTRGSNAKDRLNTRLHLLTEVAHSLETQHIVSVQSAALDIARVTDKVRIAQTYAKFRDEHPLHDKLQEIAERRGLDPERVTTNLFQKAVYEGDRAIKAYHNFLAFDHSWWNNQTAGSSVEDRLEARVDLLVALANYVEKHPLHRIEQAMEQVAIGHDKAYIAQSKHFQNITPHARELHDLATERGLNADRITTHLFERAIDEGPDSVAQLKELLEFDNTLISNEVGAGTPQDVRRAQLILLNKLATSLEEGYIVSVQSVSRDLNRLTDKREIVETFGKLRTIYPEDHVDDIRELATAQGIDPDRVTTQIFERIVMEKDRDRIIHRLQNFLTFENSWFNNTTQGTTAPGRLNAQLKLLSELANSIEEYPLRSTDKAITSVEHSFDKVFIARSYQHANITPYGDVLRNLAEESGRDPDRLTTQLFEKATAEGPRAIAALKELLEFDAGWFHSEKAGSNLADRHETRLILLDKVASYIEDASASQVEYGLTPGVDFREVSVHEAASEVHEHTDKVRIAQSFGEVRELCPFANNLRRQAIERELDPERLTTPIFQRIVDEKDRGAIDAFHDFINFSANPFYDQTRGSTKQGRLQAQVTLMNALADYIENKPNTRMKEAMQQVELQCDKVFLAQSYEYANITSKAGLLFALALKKGHDPRRVTTDIFAQAITDGQVAVDQLRELLQYSAQPQNLQTIGSSKAARLEARLKLLEETAAYLEQSPYVSVQSAAQDILRITNKVKLAQSFNDVPKNAHKDLKPTLPKLVGATGQPAPAEIVDEVLREAAPEEGRTLDKLFDFADKKRKETNDKPNIVAGVIRGKSDYKPLFKDGESKFQKFLHTTGNDLSVIAAQTADGLIHKRHGINEKVEITEEFALSFTAGAKKLREDDLGPDDPRKIAINALRNQHPNALPVWLEGDLGQGVSLKLNHEKPVGTTGATVNFGIEVDESAAVKMTRLMFLDSTLSGLSNGAKQVARLRLLPTKGANVKEMETGAKFEISGKANLKLNAGLGLGTTIPALNNYVTGKIGIFKNSYATLSGEMNMTVEKVSRDRAQIRIGKSKTSSTGVELRATADVGLNKEKIGQVFAGFAHHILGGKDPEDYMTSGSELRQRVCSDFREYLGQIAGNVAEGATGISDQMIDDYTTLAFQASKGVEITKDFTTNFDFDLGSQEMVTIPFGEWVPKEIRTGLSSEPISLKVADLAQHAYDMAVHGDLTLAQELSTIRGSGVRINEEKTIDTRKDTTSVSFKSPFGEFEDTTTLSQSVIDRFTPELGRTRTALNSFNQSYKEFFGDSTKSAGKIQVHSPENEFSSNAFVGSDKNMSVDFVVENFVDKRTDYQEMENYMGILNALSGGRLRTRCQEALFTGKYHDGDLSNDNAIMKLFEQGSEYGRTTVNLHVWLGERGIRRMLSSELNSEQLYQAIGEAFRDINRYGEGVLPKWAAPGADRRTPTGVYLFPHSLNKHTAYGDEDDTSDLEIAKFLVDNILALQDNMKWSTSAKDEEAVSLQIREFLHKCNNKLPAYAALALLVPEEDRAVEMRLTSLKNDQMPVRFSYIQDGRSPEILRCSGFANAALKQFQRFGSMLNTDSKLRIQMLLKEVNTVLNEPSPDMYSLERAMVALEEEMALLDKVALTHIDLCETDMGLAQNFIDTLPDVDTIQAILPNNVGIHLATMRREAQMQLNESNPDFGKLRSTFGAMLENTTAYRELEASSELIQNTGRLANSLVETEPELTQQAQRAVQAYREALSAIAGKANPDLSEVKAALEQVSTVNTDLVNASYDELEFRSKIAERGAPSMDNTPTLNRELAEERKKKAEEYRSLIGSPETAAVSYFERTGTVPKTAIAQPKKVLDNGIVTASQVREAELAMASTRPKGTLGIPKLPTAKAEQLTRLVKQKNFKKFVLVANKARYQPAPPYSQPKTALIEGLLVMLSPDERKAMLAALPTGRASQIRSILVGFDEDAKAGMPHKVNKAALGQGSRYMQDLNFLREIATNNPTGLNDALTTLGYGVVIDNWTKRSTARLEAALSKVTGDELSDMLEIARKATLTDIERDRITELCNLIKTSDLTPQTRAKLCGQLVDNDPFFEQDELISEALVVGMNAADLRIFFDQLYKDGKVDNFLGAGGALQSLARVGTFMVAWLFTYDNQKALAAVAKYGFDEQSIQGQYNTDTPFTKQLEKDAEAALFSGVVDPIPVDPVIKDGIKAARSIVTAVKYKDVQEFPDEVVPLLKGVGEALGNHLASRIIDLGINGATSEEILEDVQSFMKGLHPKALHQLLAEEDLGAAGAGDEQNSYKIIAKTIKEGVVHGVEHQAENSKFITPAVLTFVKG